MCVICECVFKSCLLNSTSSGLLVIPGVSTLPCLPLMLSLKTIILMYFLVCVFLVSPCCVHRDTSAYFVFLQLRSALKAYGVPWASSISSHPMRDWITPSAGRPSVSLIYNKIIDCISKPLSIKTIWNRELSDLNLSVDWERVWSNLSLTSKNLSYCLIHFKVIHRAYITPYKRFKMKLQSNLNCHIYIYIQHYIIRHFSAYVLGMSCRHQSMDTCKPGFVMITAN